MGKFGAPNKCNVLLKVVASRTTPAPPQLITPASAES
jgi:hypothetical protein